MELLLSRLEKLQPLRIHNASGTSEAEQVDKDGYPLKTVLAFMKLIDGLVEYFLIKEKY